MAVFDVGLLEPIYPGITADSLTPTVDNLAPTADGGSLIPASDAVYGAVNAHILFADIVEPIETPVTADTTLYTADNAIWPTADGGILAGAREVIDADIIPAVIEVPAGGVAPYRPLRKPFLIVGYGYGVLPALDGEAIGTIGIAGRSLGSIAKLSSIAAGVHGAAGAATASLDLSMISKGAIGVRGSAKDSLLKLNASAVGRYDDDEAALMTFLIAA